MYKKKRLFLSVLLFMFLFIQTSYAATLEDFNVSGFENVPEFAKKEILHTMESIPSNVVKYHKLLGGELYFSNTDLDIYDEHDLELKGIYYHDSYDIYVRYELDEGVLSPYNVLISETLAHELGHFVHYMAKPFLSDEHEEILLNQYNYWKDWTASCYNLDETFAFLYANYHSNAPLISDEAVKMLRDVELICEALYELKLLNPDLEFGPSTFSLYTTYIEDYKLRNV